MNVTYRIVQVTHNDPRPGQSELVGEITYPGGQKFTATMHGRTSDVRDGQTPGSEKYYTFRQRIFNACERKRLQESNDVVFGNGDLS